MTIREIAGSMKEYAPVLAASSREERDAALERILEALEAHREEIFAANREDLQRAEEDDVPVQVRKRLYFQEAKMNDVCNGIRLLMTLPDPLGSVTLFRQLDEGLLLKRVSVPIGVIGVIFEARPDALVQIMTLCLKSGNAAVLKGGKETACTNRALFDVLSKAAAGSGIPAQCYYLAETHQEIDELLGCDKDVDLLIPRGSNRFVRYIMDHTSIPVMGHAEGICHLYVDDLADIDKKLDIIADAKTQYPVACNAVETVLVKRSIAAEFLPLLAERMKQEGVEILADHESAALLGGCREIEGDDFHTEYGGLQLSAGIVEDVEEACRHINRYGSHHTDGILTADDENARIFLNLVDSAGVYRNCSTRFADGFRYGFGAEVGISTGKIHARGPVGLEGLVTYKYLLEGSGQIVGDYASGKSEFHFRDLDMESS